MPRENYYYRNQVAFVIFCFGMVILALGFVGVLLIDNKRATLANREVGKINQYYNRVTVCLASVSPVQRTPDYVKSCYATAEKQTGITAERYGDGR